MNESNAMQVATLELWRNRWRLGGAFLAFGLFAYLCLRLFVTETFLAQAQLLVRPQPLILGTRDSDARPNVEAPAFEDILRGDEILELVREEGRKTHPEWLRVEFERYRNWFKVKSLTTRDTSVVTTYSPVLSLSVEAPKPEVAKLLMDEWLRLILERFGNLNAAEAATQRAAALEANRLLQEELKRLTARERELATELSLASAAIRGRMRMLTTAPVTDAKDTSYDLRLLAGGLTSADGVLGFEVNTAPPNVYAGPGIWERMVDLQAAMAKANADPAGATAQGKALAAELAELKNVERSIEEELKAARAKEAELASALAVTRSERKGVDARLSVNTSVLAYSASQNSVPDALAAQGEHSDLKVLSRPVKPEKRVSPPSRVLLSIVAGFAMTVLLALYMMLASYMTQAARER